MNRSIRLCTAITALGILVGPSDAGVVCNIEDTCQLEFVGTVQDFSPEIPFTDEVSILFSWERIELLHRAEQELTAEGYFLHNTTIEFRHGSDVTTISGPGYSAEGTFGGGTYALYSDNGEVNLNLWGFSDEAEISINGLVQVLTDDSAFAEGFISFPGEAFAEISVASIRIVPEPVMHPLVFCLVGFFVARRQRFARH